MKAGMAKQKLKEDKADASYTPVLIMKATSPGACCTLAVKK